MRSRIALMFLLSVAPSFSRAQSTPPVNCNDYDWAGRAYYQKQNENLRPSPGRVVFIGDSITEDWADRPFFRNERRFVDRGISGQVSGKMLLRFQNDVVELHPAVVHIMAGTNDVAENNGAESDAEIEGYIRSMVENAKANGIAVILGSIPPAAGFPWRPTVTNVAPRVMRLNRWIQAYAKRTGVVYLNYWAVLSTREGGMKPEFSPDGVHPNPDGYSAMEAIAGRAIERAVKGRQ